MKWLMLYNVDHEREPSQRRLGEDSSLDPSHGPRWNYAIQSHTYIKLWVHANAQVEQKRIKVEALVL